MPKAPGQSVRVLIVDHEDASRGILRDMLQRWSRVDLVGECGTAAAARRAVRRERPDVIFLDVGIPGRGGLSLATDLYGNVPVVFVTAEPSHAAEAFDLGAVDYLVKPFSAERFERCMQRVFARVDRGRDAVTLQAKAVRSLPDPVDRVRVRVRNVTRLIAIADMEWIEAVDVYLRIHMKDGSSLMVRDVLENLEERLAASFARVHRSYLVNVLYIEQIRRRPEGNYEIVLQSGTVLRMARARWASLQMRLRSSSARHAPRSGFVSGQ